MFKRNLTKWIPLGNFNHGSADYIVFVRGNKSTGELFFKTKRVNVKFNIFFSPNNVIPINLINTSEQWQKIINELNNN